MVWMYDFATNLFNAKAYPLVVSMSYGWPEDNQCLIDNNNCNSGGYVDYLKRADAEFMKVAMKGVTLLASSGDQGAPGDSNPFCMTNTISTLYPATSPWVTSVGATMLIPGGSTLPVNQPPVCQQ
jgi:subtilase family serine protease